jgi:hypothetical protein
LIYWYFHYLSKMEIIMSDLQKIINQNPLNLTISTHHSRNKYRKPQLVILGDLRALTLGSSPAGTKDSGNTLFSRSYKQAPFQILSGGAIRYADGTVVNPDGSVISPGNTPTP